MTDSALPESARASPSINPSPSIGPQVQISTGNSLAIIEPRTILPLFLEDTSGQAALVTVVTPLSFVPPQLSPGSRSKATYSVTP